MSGTPALHFRKFHARDLMAAARLVRDVSKRYFYKDISTREGRKFWNDLQSLRKTNILRQRQLFKSLPIKMVAENGLKLVGLVAGKPDEVVMLFVRPAFHRKGIASELYGRFKHQALLKKSRLIRVKSSRYAEGFYQKAGFKRTGPGKEINGLATIPMEARI